MDKPPAILADWDEEKGPIIIDKIFPEALGDIDDSPEVLITRCYISAQSIFARAEFSKTTFPLPMVSVKKIAIVFFDIVMDTKVRGGKRPFILVLFVPIDTSFGLIDALGAAVEPFLKMYRNGNRPDLEEIQEATLNTIERGPSPQALKPAARPVATKPVQAVPTAKPVATGPVAKPAPKQAPRPAPKTERPARQPEKVIEPERAKARQVSPKPKVIARTGTPATPASQPATPSKGRPTTSKTHVKKIGLASNPAKAQPMPDRDPRLYMRSGAWIPVDVENLQKLVDLNTPVEDIAVILHRPLKDVKQRLGQS
jgi:hypothetical protein